MTNSTKDPIVCFEHSTSQKNGDIKQTNLMMLKVETPNLEWTRHPSSTSDVLVHVLAIEVKCGWCAMGRHSAKGMVVMAVQDERRLAHMMRAVSCMFVTTGLDHAACVIFHSSASLANFIAAWGFCGIPCVLCCWLCVLCYDFVAHLLITMGLLGIAGGIWAVVAWRLDIAAKEGGGEEGAQADRDGSSHCARP